MAKPYSAASAIFLAMMACSAQAGAEEGESPGADALCKEKITRVGRPNTIQTVASLSAVRFWIEAARKHGESYAVWHKAEGGAIDCKRKEGSRYYICYASGKPCLDDYVAEKTKSGGQQARSLTDF